MYIDGVEDTANFNYTYSGSFSLTDTAMGCMYGNGGGGSASSQWGRGYGDGLRLWQVVLTQAQVQDLYYRNIKPSTPYLEWLFDEGSGTTAADTSGNGRSGDLTGHAPTYSSDVFMKLRSAVT